MPQVGVSPPADWNPQTCCRRQPHEQAGVGEGMGAQRDDGSSDLDRVAGQGDARARGRLGRLSEIEREMHFLLIAKTELCWRD